MKKILIGLLTFSSLASFANDVCVITTTKSKKLVISCSDVKNGKEDRSSKNNLVELLASKTRDGFEIKAVNTISDKDNSLLVYTLVKK